MIVTTWFKITCREIFPYYVAFNLCFEVGMEVIYDLAVLFTSGLPKLLGTKTAFIVVTNYLEHVL